MRISPRLAACLLLILSCCVFGAENEIVVNLRKSGEAFVVEARLDIPVPVRSAWEVITDFDNMTKILNNLTSSRIISRNGSSLNVAQEGVAHYGIFSYSFASEREIRLEPMTRILARQLTGTAKHFESEMELSASDRGTRLRYSAQIVPDSGFARAFGASFIEHEVEEQLTAMATEMLRRQAP
jgi:carbon monoxide dehydrogenase subunit G